MRTLVFFYFQIFGSEFSPRFLEPNGCLRARARRKDVFDQTDESPDHQERAEGVGVADQSEADREHRREDEALDAGGCELLRARVGNVLDAEHVQNQVLNEARGERDNENDEKRRKEIGERVHDLSSSE